MALQVSTKERVFEYNGKSLIDPNPKMTPFEVAKFYSAEYPELINSIIDGPKISDGKALYVFEKTAGTKG